MKTKICVPVSGKTEKELSTSLDKIMKSKFVKNIDVIEFRYDMARDIPKEKLLEVLKLIRDKIGEKQLLFTIRTKVQGGEFASDFGNYESINCAAIESGYIDMVDVEIRREGYAQGAPTDRDLKSAERIIRVAKGQRVKSIASYHDFEKTPDKLSIREIFTELRESDCDIIKAAFMAKEEKDVLRLLLETRKFREFDEEKHEYLSISMGKLGSLSRVAGMLSGSDYTFVSVDKASAPGQLDIEQGIQILKILEG